MPKFFCYKPNLKDSKSRITVSKLAKICRKPVVNYGSKKYLTAGIYPSNTEYYEGGLKVFADYVHTTSITIDKDVVLACGNSIFITKEKTLTASDLDTGTAFVLGSDYYVYICDPSNGDESSDVEEEYKISLNSTYPEGYNESNSRKIGGFHYGRVRKVTDELIPFNTSYQIPTTAISASITNYNTNTYEGIVPNSVWTLLHRPKCSPEGMVYLGGNLWGDIYLSSDDGSYGLQSVKAKTPLLSPTWYGFDERARRVGKKLPNYAEWCISAIAQPTGADNNTNARTKSDNSAVGATGAIAHCTSGLNVRESIGNVWRHSRDIFPQQTALTMAWKNMQSSLKAGGILDGECGDLYITSAYMCAIRFGSDYQDSTKAGKRNFDVNASYYTHGTSSTTGVWLVCNSI